MLRLYYPDELAPNSEVLLNNESAHHLVHVMRAKVDDDFIMFNEAGEFNASISSIAKKNVNALIGSQRACHTESDCNITLLQTVTRRERMDHSIQKATELGVTCIQPILTDHCVVKLDAKKSVQKVAHWQGIAQHASEQSGRLKIPLIKPVLKMEQALREIPDSENHLKLIFALIASSPLKHIQNDSKNIYVALGPVGGFSEKEVLHAQASGFQGIKLGPRILRAETATVAALTAIQMLWGDLN